MAAESDLPRPRGSADSPQMTASAALANTAPVSAPAQEYFASTIFHFSPTTTPAAMSLSLNKKSIKDVDVKDKRVLMRVDFNVPQDYYYYYYFIL